MALMLRRLRRTFLSNLIPRLFIGLVVVYVYCEYLIYYVTQIQCGWPTLSQEPTDGVEPVYAMVIADTHLLGSRHGHWFDKWRREWQMHRAFQSAMTLHSPDVVFVLGDLFDEGLWCPEKEFNDYVERFYQLFKVPDGTAMYSVVGNHDIGFHYRITPQLVRRFETRLKSPPVQLVSIRGNHFVLINSMAMEGDGCTLCARTVAQIANISNILKCSSGSSLCKGNKKLERYSRPIIMQHYPLYRESDSGCTEPDAAPLPERNSLFEERWDCLSKESTEYLVESLRPRTALGAHTHHSCVVRHSFVPTPDHKIEFVEYTVPSFSWRNRLDPKYYLLTITPEEVKVSKCGMPREWTLQITAILMTLALLVYLRYYATTNNRLSYKLLVLYPKCAKRNTFYASTVRPTDSTVSGLYLMNRNRYGGTKPFVCECDSQLANLTYCFKLFVDCLISGHTFVLVTWVRQITGIINGLRIRKESVRLQKRYN